MPCPCPVSSRSTGTAICGATWWRCAARKALARLERERDAFSDREDLTDEEMERCDRLDAEIDALSETAFVFSDRQKTRAGAILGIDHRGKLDIVRGLVRSAHSKPAKREDTDGESGDAPSPAGLPRTLIDDLTAHRTAALRAVLAERPDVGLAVAVHALAQTVFYDGRDESPVAVHAASPALRAEGIEDSAAAKRLMQQRGMWATQLPEQPEALWDWLLAQETGTVLALLAHCIACTVKPERSTATQQLAAAVALDMAQWWQPSASYFGRVPKPLILEAVTEGKGGAAAETIAALKKGEMADRAAALLTGTGWIPPMLRAA